MALKCKKCKKEIDIIGSPIWDIIEKEGHHTVDCPLCQEEITISVLFTYELECLK